MPRARDTATRQSPLPLLLSSVAIAGLIAAAYHGSFAIPFLLDDLGSIEENAAIREVWPPWAALAPAPDSPLGGRPLANLSFALNHAWHGTSVAGYHAVNLALHILGALTLFGLVRRTLMDTRAAAGIPRPNFPGWSAAFIAALWGVHPVTTGAVSYLSQRTEVLMGLCYLLTLYAFIRAHQAPRARGWLALSVACCFAGMASKEVMVTAPVVVLLFDRTFISGTFRAALRDRAWYYGALASSWLLLALLLPGLAERGVGLDRGVSAWTYALTASRALVTYLRLAFWPHPLVFDYGPDFLTDLAAAANWIVIVLGALALTALALWRTPRAGFLGAWFFLILAPTSSVIPIALQPVAENRLYLPLIAAMVGVTLLTVRTTGRAAPWLLAAATGALAGLTVQRNVTLQSPIALWTETVQRQPGNPRAHASLGLAQFDRGHAAEAIPHFQRALALDPRAVATEQNLGNAYFKLGQLAEAEARFRRVVELSPSFASGYNNLGATLLERRDYDGALAALATARRLEPNHTGAHQNTARALFALGRFAEAVPHYERVQQARPDSPDAHYDLGLALARAGNIDRAAQAFSAALRLRPNPGSYLNYARFLVGAGRTADAITNLEQALRLQPNFTDARRELERLRAMQPTPAPRP